MKFKKCTKCNTEKEIAFFYYSKKKQVYSTECKYCKYLANKKTIEFSKIENLLGELWVDIVGFEGLYQISNLGRIKTLQRIKSICNEVDHVVSSEKILLPRKNRYGYLRISFFKNPLGAKEFTMHRLMAIHFIPNPENKPEVNHINGIKDDNRLENLEWCTAKENAVHARAFGLRENTYGEKSKKSKLTEFQVRLIKRIYRRYGRFNMAKLSRKLNVSETTVSYVLKNKIWTHVEI